MFQSKYQYKSEIVGYRFTVSKILQGTICVHIETLSYSVEAAEKMMDSTNKYMDGNMDVDLLWMILVTYKISGHYE